MPCRAFVMSLILVSICNADPVQSTATGWYGIPRIGDADLITRSVL